MLTIFNTENLKYNFFNDIIEKRTKSAMKLLFMIRVARTFAWAFARIG